MRYLTLAEVLSVHHRLMQESGGPSGDKRVAHASMEVFLVLNRYELECSVEEQEAFWLALAAGEKSRDDLVAWMSGHLRPLEGTV
jgi:death-on-curing protein